MSFEENKNSTERSVTFEEQTKQLLRQLSDKTLAWSTFRSELLKNQRPSKPLIQPGRNELAAEMDRAESVRELALKTGEAEKGMVSALEALAAHVSTHRLFK